METNKKVIFLSLMMIFFLLFFVGMFFWQQKAIHQLELDLESAVSQLASPQSEKMKAESTRQFLLEDREKIIEKQQNEEKINFVSGSIKNISGNVLEIDANIPDWEKMKQIVASPELSREYQNKMAPTIKKVYTVTITSETKFAKNNLSLMKAGDTAYVASKENANKTDRLTAIEVISPDESPFLSQ